MTWQICIPHIPHRHTQLIELLDVLAPQIRSGVSVLIYSDNLEASYADKCQALVDASDADYISFLSNDDSVSPNFVQKICKALKEKPDYVGFKVRYTVDGQVTMPIVHSLQYEGWIDAPDALYRDIVHFNPIRRELAEKVTFRGHHYADRDWADDLRALGCVKTEVFIDEELHYYQWRRDDWFLTPRQPMRQEEIPELPSYSFVTYIR